MPFLFNLVLTGVSAIVAPLNTTVLSEMDSTPDSPQLMPEGIERQRNQSTLLDRVSDDSPEAPEVFFDMFAFAADQFDIVIENGGAETINQKTAGRKLAFREGIRNLTHQLVTAVDALAESFFSLE